MTNNGMFLSRRGAVQTLAAGAATLALKETFTNPTFAAAASPAISGHNPGAHWERYAKPQDAGFTSDLTNILELLYPAPTTSVTMAGPGTHKTVSGLSGAPTGRKRRKKSRAIRSCSQKTW